MPIKSLMSCLSSDLEDGREVTTSATPFLMCIRFNKCSAALMSMMNMIQVIVGLEYMRVVCTCVLCVAK